MPNNAIGIAQWALMYPRLAELTRNLALSAGDIARILNDEFQPAVPLTRHAVIGKVYRNGLRRPEAARIKTPPPPQKPQPPPPPPQKPQPPPPPPQIGLSIMELAGSSCRWPIAGAGADMRYCGVGEASLPAVPYCREHARMAYNGKGQSAQSHG